MLPVAQVTGFSFLSGLMHLLLNQGQELTRLLVLGQGPVEKIAETA